MDDKKCFHGCTAQTDGGRNAWRTATRVKQLQIATAVHTREPNSQEDPERCSPGRLSEDAGQVVDEEHDEHEGGHAHVQVPGATRLLPPQHSVHHPANRQTPVHACPHASV